MTRPSTRPTTRPQRAAPPDAIWIVDCPDVFGGYGLIATGRTRAEARASLWKRYRAESPQWNHDIGRGRQIGYPTLAALEDYFGIAERRVIVGRTYFGTEGEPEATQ